MWLTDPMHQSPEYEQAKRRLVDEGYIYIDDEYIDTDYGATVLVLVRDQ